jgi:hypothetical protein
MEARVSSKLPIDSKSPNVCTPDEQEKSYPSLIETSSSRTSIGGCKGFWKKILSIAVLFAVE